MSDQSHAEQAADIIKKKAAHIKPKVALILGSGLGRLASLLTDSVAIPYEELPGYSSCTIAGQASIMHLGFLEHLPMVCLQGRPHYYEGHDRASFFTFIRTLKLIGCEMVILTNAAGSLHEDVGPGSIVLIKDHINFLPFNPLIGQNDANFGPRFIGMENAYDEKLCVLFKTTAEQRNIPLNEGVYAATSGPTFETPAEVRAMRMLGVDVVAMSAIPEVIVSRHCGLRVALLSVISNYAAGMRPQTLSHKTTLEGVTLGVENLFQLILSTLKKL